MPLTAPQNVTPPPALVGALRRLLKPLAKLMLAHGATYPFLSEMLKSVLVEVANDQFQIGNRRQTDSRISLLTGVHRKDVKRLRGADGAARHTAPASVSLGAQLVAAWTGMPQYLDENDRPRALPRLASRDKTLSFEGLVEGISKDIRARAVLDEWLRLGIAHLDDDDRVCLNVEAFIPETGFDEKAFYFGHNLHDHLAAGTHNLMGDKPPFIERSVYYDHLLPQSVQELAQMAERYGMQALKAINRRAMEMEKADAQKDEAGQRMTFGVYFFREEGEISKGPGE